MPGTALIGAQWGDEGKGKLTDLFAEQMDMVVRATGGDNAGHTIVVGDETYKLRLLPSGILYPHVVPVIGNGVALNPGVLLAELQGLTDRGINVSRLRISANAHLVMPYHRELDKVTERFLGRNKLGTTKRGIGPAYADKARRIGVRLQDLFDEKIFRQKVEIALKDKNQILTKLYNRMPLDIDAIMEEYFSYASSIEKYMADTSLLTNDALKAQQKVLFEGAQGTLLDIDHGTYPYVTSSNPTAGGMCVGAGVGPRALNRIVGIAKAYTTRVGGGPFPTELFGEEGAHLRKIGREFGTVTGRDRRCGWLDLPILRFAVRINSFNSFALTKLDILSEFDSLKVCVGYEYNGKRYDEMPFHQSVLHHVSPLYEILPGWQTDITQCTEYDQLPKEAMDYVAFVEEHAGVPVDIVSVGPERAQTLLRKTA